MKTRKLLPLIILTVAAVLALSSCDAILDAIFASNQITVDVAVFGTLQQPSNPGSYVSVVLSNTSGYVASENGYSRSSIDGFGYVHFYVTFPKLEDDTYFLSVLYHGYLGGIWASPFGSTYFYDPDGYLTNNCTMPFPSSYDSTGRSATFNVEIY